ncbi:MAG: hypothetical protein ACYYKD_10435 [Rhodospirillales bacterium]
MPVESENGYVCRDCGAPNRTCPKCGGLLLEIPRKNGEGSFFGCTNHFSSGCTHTENLPDQTEQPPSGA